MTSWSRAYKAAAAFVAYTLAWDIFGAFVMLIGLGISGSALFAPILGTSGASLTLTGYQLVVGIIITILGLAIGLLGNIATFFKISSEVNADEVESRIDREEPIAAK